MPQPPLHTRQRSLLVTASNHLYKSNLYYCAQDTIEKQDGAGFKSTASVVTEGYHTLYKTTQSKLKVDASRRQRLQRRRTPHMASSANA